MDPETATPASLGTPPTSPTPSSVFEDGSIPVIATDELGMIANDELELPNGLNHAPELVPADASLKDLKPKTKRRQPRKNVSRHFQTPCAERQARALLQSQETQATMTPPLTPRMAETKRKTRDKLPRLESQQLPEIQPRFINGVNIDEDLSSDSSLTSVPSDIGPDPFSTPPTPPKLLAIKTKRPGPKHPTKSPYFAHKSRPTFISSILPFPPLSHPRFGIMQERLASDPFRLLIATIFLNKTPGARAMPIFYDIMEQYPTPRDLAGARVEDVVSVIRCLGFQNQRARKCVSMARVWVECPPVRGKRWAKRDYPRKGDGRGMKGDDWLGDEADEGAGNGKVAWEISHLPGLGAYAHDSWRIFCRDKLRGLAEGWNGEGTKPMIRSTTMKQEAERCEARGVNVNSGDQKHETGLTSKSTHEKDEVPFEPEWKRVLPADKELRAWMTWMWLKEGWVWNKETGERTRASEELMEKARGGGVVREETERECLVVEGVGHTEYGDDLDKQVLEKTLDTPAGTFMEPSHRDGDDIGNGVGFETGHRGGEALDAVIDQAQEFKHSL